MRPPRIPTSLAVATLPDQDLTDECILENFEFTKLDLPDREARLVEIDRCRFQEVNLSGTALQRARGSDLVVVDSDLANFSAESSSLSRARFETSRLTGGRWVDGKLRHVIFSHCRLDLAVFWETTFEEVTFEDCNLAHVDFADADLSGTTFVRCDLSRGRLLRAKMEGVRIESCKLDAITGIASMRGSSVTSADLQSLTYAFAREIGIEIVD